MKLTDEHLERIDTWLSDGFSFRHMARELGCDPGTVRKFADQNWPGRVPIVLAPEVKKVAAFVPASPVDELELAQDELKRYKAAARKDRKVDVQAERLLSEIRELTPAAAPIYEAPDIAEGEGHSHTHVLLLSDLHCGEVVDSEAMNGLGEYDYEILCSRMQSIHRSLISYQNNRPYPIDELRIWSLGDMTGGKHHQELAETNEFGLAQQAWKTGMLLGKFIESLADAYPKIHVTGIAGNHARMNDKAQAKQVFDSFDWLASKTSELYLAKYPTITHNYPLSGFVLDKVAGKTALLGHGDGIFSNMPGVPWGGVLRRFNNMVKTYAQIGEHLDYFALGHFHQLNVVKGVFMNGSVKGPDEYILKKYGTADPWEQLLLTFDTTAGKLTDASYINGE